LPGFFRDFNKCIKCRIPVYAGRYISPRNNVFISIYDSGRIARAFLPDFRLSCGRVFLLANEFYDSADYSKSGSNSCPEYRYLPFNTQILELFYHENTLLLAGLNHNSQPDLGPDYLTLRPNC